MRLMKIAEYVSTLQQQQEPYVCFILSFGGLAWCPYKVYNSLTTVAARQCMNDSAPDLPWHCGGET